MPNVFIFHGAYGSPSESWIPWLREELEKIGCKVFVPAFPTPENQSLESWLGVFKRFEDSVDENTVFVGHSLGANFILHLLERTGKRIRAAFLVAGFVTPVVDPEGRFNRINRTFYEKKLGWSKINGGCRDFYVINSDDDPYVTLEMAEKISKPLGVTLIVMEKAGHFTKKSGYAKFPQLLDMVEDAIATSPEG